MAIDYGRKRCGIAVTDPLQIIANSLTTVATKDLLTFILDYVKKENVETIVIGEPKDMQNNPNSDKDDVVEAANILFEKTKKKLKVQIKIDTGMNRIGIGIKEAREFIKTVQNSKAVELTGIFTHFCDVENKEIFTSQKENFKNLINSTDSCKLPANGVYYCLSYYKGVDR